MARQQRLIIEDYIEDIDSSEIVGQNGVGYEFSPEFIFGLDFSIMTNELLDPKSKVVATHALFRKFFENYIPWVGRFSLTAECLWEEGEAYEGRQQTDISQKDLIKFFKEVTEYCESENINFIFADYRIEFEVDRVPSFREFCSCVNKLWENIVSKDCTLYIRRTGDSQLDRIPLMSHQRLHYSFLSYADLMSLYQDMFKGKPGYKEAGPEESQQWYNETYVSKISKNEFLKTLIRIDKYPRMFKGVEMNVWGFQNGSDALPVDARQMSSTSYNVFIEVIPDDNTTDSVIKAVKSIIGTMNKYTVEQLCSGRMRPAEMFFCCIVDDSVVMDPKSKVFFDEVKMGNDDMKFYISLWVPSIDGYYYRVNTNGEISNDTKLSRKLIDSYRVLFETQKK